LSHPAPDPSRLYVALDLDSKDEALALVDRLEGLISSYKVGSALFTTAGPGFVQQLARRGFNVFVDLKFFDIPSVVAAAVGNVARLGAKMMTLHTLGGREMMRAAAEAARGAAGSCGASPLLFGVTLLTSIDERSLSEDLSSRRPLDEQVLHLAGLAVSAGLDGVVASGQELKLLKSRLGSKLKVIVPGVRPQAVSDDQKRTITPRQAILLGADYIVVGRPITRAADPRAAAQEILQQTWPG